MSNIVITETFLSQLKKDGQADTKSKQTRGKLLDMAQEIGIDFTKETMSKEQLQQVMQTIPLRFPKPAQKILALGATKANGAIAATWTGARYNSQGRPCDFKYWTNETKAVLRGLKNGIIARNKKAARVAAGGTQTRTFVQRHSEEVQALFDNVNNIDPDNLPDHINVTEVQAAYNQVAKAIGFTLCIRDK